MLTTSANAGSSASHGRRLHVGAEVLENGGVHFLVWAPGRTRVDVAIVGDHLPLTAETGGYFSGVIATAADGSRYRYRLDGDPEQLYPDPASRYQPEGPFGPSEVVDPARYRWGDQTWCAQTDRRLEGQVLYEMHIGTFTREGTCRAAADRLEDLAELGITLIELMPLADFAGTFGWGYDGVNLFAPTRLYGTPECLRAFVDKAHQLNIGVILDVVYNHLGPDGNFLARFSPSYFSTRYKTDWGEAINFDGKDSEPVREFFIDNARYWIDEFHFDGLRLDATQNIYDSGPVHILKEIGQAVRSSAAGRTTFLVAENEPQEAILLQPVEKGGHGLDAVWNDDFHHSAMVALTGRNEAYYTDYFGTPQEFISALKYGYLYQGQRYRWQSQPRGNPALDAEPPAFVLFVQNHDQVANSLRGHRVDKLTSPGRLRAMTALLLLAPGTPMLFQGQEFAASAPFLYFSDHKPSLAALVHAGRREFLSQFRSLANPEAMAQVDDPAARSTFERSKLNHAERVEHAEVYALHRDLLQLRRDDPAIRRQRKGSFDGAVLSPHAFLLRYFSPQGDRLLLVNLDVDLDLPSIPEPLTAPPAGQSWAHIFSTENVRYGGNGTCEIVTETGWRIPGNAAVLLAPSPSRNSS